MDVSLLFLDLDSFRTINDTLGHDQGDAVLKSIADRLLAVTRSTDTVARIGGDEFVILCGNADSRAAVHVGERVLGALRPPLQIAGHALPVTASIGMATAEDQDRTVLDLLRRADAAMYQAKRSGKDQAARDRAGGGRQPNVRFGCRPKPRRLILPRSHAGLHRT